ncbi:protein SUPPRESSOR OF QUENCHING 1, chloroplastic-like [Curcuma longa]|uniref:protein SUPPRESSOR OF QUENCHING 1, chloroplastic-like n=1 Tax=Curcuma longa TaxID=136217 RepID=UPI003D9DF2C4
MAQGLTTLAFKPVSFRIYPPHSPHSSLVSGTFSSSALRRRRRRGPPLSLDLMPVGPSTAAVVLASPSQQAEGEAVGVGEEGAEWGKVSAVLFDMDGVLCNSEELSRLAAVDVFADMGVSVTTDDFIPFMGTGEANFLGGVARAKGVKGFDPEAAKKRFFEIYLAKYAKPEAGIGFPGALELIMECKRRGLKVAVASSADRIKVDANLAAAGLPVSLFDAIVSADAFENLKPAPDIFLAASKNLNVPESECIVIEDALAGVQAAKAAQMRCIAVTTTLPEGKLQQAGPSLIRKQIGNVSINDVLYGGRHSLDQSV